MTTPPGERRTVERVLTLDELAPLSLDLLCVADLGTATFLWLSPNWASVLGYPLSDLCDGSFVRFVHPDDLTSTVAEVEAMRGGAKVIHFVNRYRTREGGWRWLEWNAMPYSDGTTFAIARDVTETERIQREATERSRLLELASAIGKIGYWRIDIDKETLWWSDGVFQIHGRDPARGMPTVGEAVDAYHPDDRERVDQLLSRAIAQKEEFDFELRLVRDDGAIRQVVARGRIEPGPTGAAASVFGTFQDVTEERQTQAKLRRSERLVSLGTLAAGVAHEINNPLAYVVGNLSMLVEELDDPELAQMARDAASGADHVRRIVEGLRSFSRMNDAGERESVSMTEILDGAVQLAAHQVRHRAELERVGARLPRVLGDRVALVQVFCNLLINAAQAVPEGRRGRVRVRGGVEGEHVVVDVEDDGPGIPGEVQERIFDPFFTTKEAGQGTGLGLSICMGTVEAHGGSLRLVEARPGRTCFRVQLPICGAACDAVSAPAQSALGPADSLVVVIEDDPHVISMIARALPGHEVRSFLAAEEALDALAGGLRPEVIVCDLMMPGMSGWQVHDVLRQRHPELVEHVVYMTGGAFGPEAERFLAAVPDDRRLLKPFMPSELRRIVRSAQ